MARTVEEIQASREARRAAQDAQRKAQLAADLDAIDTLEASRGDTLHTMTANGFKLGAPVKAAFRAPTGGEYKRYCDMVGRAMKAGDMAARQAAQEMLAASCLVYPAPDSAERKAMLEAYPGLLISLAIEAAKVAELRAEDEGKD